MKLYWCREKIYHKYNETEMVKRKYVSYKYIVTIIVKREKIYQTFNQKLVEYSFVFFSILAVLYAYATYVVLIRR